MSSKPTSRPKPVFQLTPEQLALQAKRRELKAKKEVEQKAAAESNGGIIWPEGSEILVRPWVEVPGGDVRGGRAVKVMTWNVLAQSLVRSDLFIGSDCLKSAAREHMLPREILTYSADIVCLQEVDRLDVLLKSLNPGKYDHAFASGRGKKHGLAVLYKQDHFTKHCERVIYYDEEDVRDGHCQDESLDEAARIRWRRGMTRTTRNIGFVLALRSTKDQTAGYIVATTHLFWHPAFVYERARQMVILIREVARFQEQHGLQSWPCVIGGDFNISPEDPAYAILLGDPLTEKQRLSLNASLIMHSTVDPSIQKLNDKRPIDIDSGEEEEREGHAQTTGQPQTEAQAQAASGILPNTRRAEPRDGLLSEDELMSIARATTISLQSAYDKGLAQLPQENGFTIQQRIGRMIGRKGAHEPIYTSYTHYWQSTLDYIFFTGKGEVRSLILPHRTEDFGIGLPKRGVCASDHVSLACTLLFSDPDS